MIEKFLTYLAEKYQVVGNLQFTGCIHFDNRQISEGDWWVALPGEKRDGHDFVNTAAEKNAGLLIVSREWWNSASPKPDGSYLIVDDTLVAFQNMAAYYRSLFPGTVVGITGSAGKTTTREWIVNVLKQKFMVNSTSGNYNNHIGLPFSILNSNLDSDYWVFEIGTNHPGEIEQLADIMKPDWSILTNIGTAHIGYFGTQKNIFLEKQMLFEKTKSSGVVFINLDDPWIRSYETSRKTITFSLEHEADYSLTIDGRNYLGQYSVLLHKNRMVELPVPGHHQVYNALIAAAVGFYAEMDEASVARGLESYAGPTQRMEIAVKSPWIIINDAYNANKESMIAAIDYLESVDAPRKILILGDIFELGEMTDLIHEEVLQYADIKKFDYILTIGPAMNKWADFLSHTPHKGFDKHTEIQAFLKSYLQKDDLVLLKASRGMQMEKILEDWN